MGKGKVEVSPSLEDYLEAVLEIADAGGARTTDVAERLGVSKASVNQAMGILADHGLVERERYGPVFLTENGMALAQAVQRRHQTIKAFLMTVLGVDEEVAEKDACQIEHVISKDTMNRIIEYMERRQGE